jgi:hypothetical protein
VYGTRDELFAGAAFAPDKNIVFALGNLIDTLQHSQKALILGEDRPKCFLVGRDIVHQRVRAVNCDVV